MKGISNMISQIKYFQYLKKKNIAGVIWEIDERQTDGRDLGLKD